MSDLFQPFIYETNTACANVSTLFDKLLILTSGIFRQKEIIVVKKTYILSSCSRKASTSGLVPIPLGQMHTPDSVISHATMGYIRTIHYNDDLYILARTTL